MWVRPHVSQRMSPAGMQRSSNSISKAQIGGMKITL